MNSENSKTSKPNALMIKLTDKWDLPKDTPHPIDVDSTWIYVDTSKTKFGRISTLFPRTFYDVTSMTKKFTLFPRTFFDVILMV